jgi:hypothetical protein
MRGFLVMSVISLCQLTANGQTGGISIVKDSRIDALVQNQSNIIPPSVKPKINGYRIQLYFDADKGKINSARARFIQQFPKVDTYVVYSAPNFFLKVGDFRTRLEAEKIKAAIEMKFPTSFVIKEKINLPRLDNK